MIGGFPCPPPPGLMLIVFALTLFFSAAMLFLVEPLVGKMMLPLLGGTPAVWNTCMVFFQAVLLAGYGYAHASNHWLGARKQAALHMGVLLLPIPLLFLIFNGPKDVLANLITGRESNPIPALLLVLTVLVGLPMFVVCSSAPILQKWFANTDHPAAKDPYFLYAASNFGSILGLFGYPLVVEPFFSLAGQRVTWSISFIVLAGLTATCAWLMWKSRLAPGLALEGMPAGFADPGAVSGPAPALGPSSTGVTGAANGPLAASTNGPGSPALAPSSNLGGAAPGAIKAGGPAGPGGPSEKAQLTREKPRKKKKDKDRIRAEKPRPSAAPAPLLESATETTRQQPVTLLRRLRWVMLAIVPSSLMMGATTYMTTDIAAIPLLWVMPLFLYLLTFMIVFAKISPRTQAIVVWCMLAAAVAVLFGWGAPMLAKDNDESSIFVWLVRMGCVPLLFFSLRVLQVRSPDLLHKAMVMFMPLLVLLVVFLILSDVQIVPGGIVGTIVLHLLTLFVVSMVCHGELARDRPPPKYLTEFFLLMSAGGVIGGLFNGLLAPLVFIGIVEYPLAMVVACLLVPPLGTFKDSKGSRYADIGLAVLFVAVGGLLFYLHRMDVNEQIKKTNKLIEEYRTEFEDEKELYRRQVDTFKDRIKDPAMLKNLKADYEDTAKGQEYVKAIDRLNERLAEQDQSYREVLATGPWKWVVGAVLLALFLGAGAWATNWGAPPAEDGAAAPNHPLDRVLDLVLPLALALLVVGLYWGLPSERVVGRLKKVSEFLNARPMTIRNVLTYGLPAILCYTFVERSLRFGLGLAGILIASTYCSRLEEPPIFQDRSFFGVLKVQERGQKHANNYALRLVHGSTLHGKQYINNIHYRHQPLTYYHRTGPVGLTFAAYNQIDRPIGVIGLGTGTMACYPLVNATMLENGKPVRDTRPCFDMTDHDAPAGEEFEKRIVKVHKSQKLTFYDIDPIVIELSGLNGRYFKYLSDSTKKGVHIDIVVGDARLTMANQDLQGDDKYGLLIIDAFSSDAIPVHLITLEALDMYLTKMREDGIILFHISNRYLDLQPVLANLVEKRDLACLHMSDDDEDEDRHPGKSRSHWVCISRKPPKTGASNYNPNGYMQKLIDNEQAHRNRVRAFKKGLAKDGDKVITRRMLQNNDLRGVSLQMLPGLFMGPNPGIAPSNVLMATYGVTQAEIDEDLHIQEWVPSVPKKDVGIWTDDYSNILSVFYPYTRWRDTMKKKWWLGGSGEP